MDRNCFTLIFQRENSQVDFTPPIAGKIIEVCEFLRNVCKYSQKHDVNVIHFSCSHVCYVFNCISLSTKFDFNYIDVTSLFQICSYFGVDENCIIALFPTTNVYAKGNLNCHIMFNLLSCGLHSVANHFAKLIKFPVEMMQSEFYSQSWRKYKRIFRNRKRLHEYLLKIVIPHCNCRYCNDYRHRRIIAMMSANEGTEGTFLLEFFGTFEGSIKLWNN